MNTTPQLKRFYAQVWPKLRRSTWRLGLTRGAAPRVLLGMALVWALVAALHALAELEHEQANAPPPTPTTNALLVWPWRVEAGLDATNAQPTDIVTVTLRVEAPAQRPALELRTTSLVGLEPVDECWVSNGPGPDCAPGRSRAGEWLRAATEQRTAVLLVARLRVLGTPGQRALRWRLSVPGVSAPQDLLLGPLVVTPRPQRWLRLERTFYATLRELLWPGLAALLGFLLQNFLQRRSERQQVWSVIFPKAWANAQKHLLAVVSNAQALAGLLGRKLDPAAPPWDDAARRAWASGDDGRGALYFALAMGYAMYRTRREGGSLFLSSLSAEDVVMQCWALVWRRIRQHLGRERVLPFFERPKLWKSRVAFEAGTLAERSALDDGFSSWLRDARLPLDLALLRTLEQVLQFEVDAMCGAWYGEAGAPQAPFATLEALTRELNAAATLDLRDRQELAAALATYRTALRGRGHFDA
jgi:hypothetical protein